MGMAASQARYLALVARKSNCEYEGQQINQARTALSNQSANLFNQMLGLSVPVPPSTQDFTTTQYSYTDGLNGSTITSWQQLATPEEDYNYVVTHHYNADVYTGAQKKLSDPQVQYTKGVASTPVEMTAAIKSLTSARAEYDKIQSDYDTLKANYEAAVKSQAEAQATYDAALKVRQEAELARDESLTAYNAAKAASEAYIAPGTNYDNLKTAKDTANENLKNAIEASKTLSNYQLATGNTWTYGAGDTKVKNADGSYTMGTDSFVPLTSLNASSNLGSITFEDITKSIDALIDIGALPANFDKSTVFVTASAATPAIAFKNDLDSALVSATDYTVPRYEIAPTDDNSILKQVEAQQANIDALTATYDDAAYKFGVVEAEYQNLLVAELQAKNTYDANEAIFKEADLAMTTAEVSKQLADEALRVATEARDESMVGYEPIVNAYENALAVYKSYQSPEFIGNCELTLLESLTKDQAAELKQVVTDMAKLDITPAINDCFDADGNYLGGVYQFKMNGVTYYTSFAELNDSFQSGRGINHIDGQAKLNYYNASYVETKIEKTEKALLETDGYGRFTSVRFEDNSVTYKLNMETVTDDVAYQDAMNQYYYENAKYDKMIQDINAKTSIIQQEDQQLELRLKQLDTEQSALSTEMEAVKKVVDDNVESSFKTFGG